MHCGVAAGAARHSGSCPGLEAQARVLLRQQRHRRALQRRHAGRELGVGLGHAQVPRPARRQRRQLAGAVRGALQARAVHSEQVALLLQREGLGLAVLGELLKQGALAGVEGSAVLQRGEKNVRNR